MYWKFLLALFLTSLIMPFVYSLISAPLIWVYMFLLKKLSPDFDSYPESGTSFPSLPVGLLNIMFFVLEAYILCGWSAIVAVFTSFGAHELATGSPWLYYITGFILFNTPLAYMEFKEQSQGIGTSIHSAIALVAFIVFILSPETAFSIYGWLIRIVY